jgi:hypothetical protein
MVLPVPGTSSRSTCPLARKAARNRAMTAVLPKKTFSILDRIKAEKPAMVFSFSIVKVYQIFVFCSPIHFFGNLLTRRHKEERRYLTEAQSHRGLRVISKSRYFLSVFLHKNEEKHNRDGRTVSGFRIDLRATVPL